MVQKYIITLAIAKCNLKVKAFAKNIPFAGDTLYSQSYQNKIKINLIQIHYTVKSQLETALE